MKELHTTQEFINFNNERNLGALEPCRFNDDGKLVPNRTSTTVTGDEPGLLCIPREGIVVIDIDDKRIPKMFEKYLDGLVTETDKGWHLWLETDQHYKGGRIVVDDVKIDLRAHGINEKKGTGVYVPGSKKYEDRDAPTHTMPKPDAPLMRLTDEDAQEIHRLLATKSKPKTEKKKSVKAANDNAPTIYAKNVIEKGSRHTTLNNLGCDLVTSGLCKKDRDYIVESINNSFCVPPYDEMEALEKARDELAEREGLRCEMKLVRNNKEDGVPTTIKMCFKELGYEFRKNTRKEGIEWKHPDKNQGQWQTNDPSDVRDWCTNDSKDGIKHSFNAFVKMDGRSGENLGLRCDLKPFKFSEQDVKITFKGIMRDNAYDPWVDYLEECLKEYREELDKTNPKDFVIWKAHHEILGFEKPSDVIDEKFINCKDEWNRWLLYLLMFPAVFNTIHPDSNKFSPMVVMIGQNGCFKSSLAKYLLPPHLRADHYKTTNFLKSDEELARVFGGSIFVEFSELDGIHKSPDRTKDIVGRQKEDITKKYKEGSEPVLRKCSWFGASNRAQPLAYSADDQRRWAPFYVYRNKEITERGIKENKTTGGFIDYLVEWSDKHRRRLCAETYYMVKVLKMDPALPYEMDKLRESYVKMASGYRTFYDEVKKAFEHFIFQELKAVDYEMVYQLTEEGIKKRSPKRDETIRQVYKELGGKGEMGRGTYWTTDEKDGEGKKHGRYFSLADMEKTSDTARGLEDV